jgi:hypothetical protein
MATSLQNINKAMPELQIGAKAVGDVVGILTTRAGMAATAIVALALAIRKYAIAKNAMSLLGVMGGTAAIAAITAITAQYGYEKWREGRMRAVERSRGALEKTRSEIAALEELRQVVSDTNVATQTLAKAKEMVAAAAEKAGVAFDKENASADGLTRTIDVLIHKQKMLSAAFYSEYLAAQRRDISSMKTRSPMGVLKNAAALAMPFGGSIFGHNAVIEGLFSEAFNYTMNSQKILETALEVAETMREHGASEKNIRGEMKRLLGNVYSSVASVYEPKYLERFGVVERQEMRDFLANTKTFSDALMDLINNPLEHLAAAAKNTAIRLDAIRGTADPKTLYKSLADLARNYFIGRDVTGADGKKISIRGKRFADSFYYSVERQRNRRAFGDAFDKEYNLSSVVQEIIKSAGNPRDAQKMLQAFVMGGQRALDTFPQIAAAIRKVNPRLLDTYGPYMRGGVYGMANEFSLRRDGRRLSPESVNALIQDMAGNETELSSNTDALKQLTAAIQDLDQKIAPPGTGLTPEMLQPGRRNVAALMPYDIPPMLARPGMVGGGAAATVVINLNDGQLAAFVARAGEALAHTIPIADEAAAKSSALIAAARAAKARGAAIANT